MAGGALNVAGLLINKVTHMELSDSQPTHSQPAFESPVKTSSSASIFSDVKGYVLEALGLFVGPKNKDSLHNPGGRKELREALEKSTIKEMNAHNSVGHAPIHSLMKRRSATKKELKRMKLLVTLLTYGDVEVDQMNSEGDTALHMAVMAGDLGAIKVLITFGADVDTLNAAQQTPVDMLKSPYRAVSNCLQNSKKVTRSTQEHRTEQQRQVVSPTEIPPPPKLPRRESEDTDFTDPEQKEFSVVISDDHEMSNHFEQRSTLDELPPTDTLTVPGPTKKRSLSLTSPPELQAILPVTYDHSHSQPSMSGILEKRAAYERMSDDKIGKLVCLLRSAGAVSRTDAFRKKSNSAKPVSKMNRITFDESSEKVTEYESVASKSFDEVGSHRVLCCTTRLTYYNKLREAIEKRLNNISAPLSNTPDEAIALAMQMREMKMFQMAGSRILFLDGGGLRGLIQIEILSQLEKSTGRKVTELFDWIVGTSTGGIVALGLVYGKKSLAEMRQFYFKARDDVFHDPKGGLSFDSDALQAQLQGNFGTEMRMNDVKYPRVIIPATYKKSINLKLHFFNNCFDDEFSKQLVWKVARYTSAAPIFFTEFEDYVDGGILAQNPSSTVLTAIQEFYRSRGMRLPISTVVSIGSGEYPDDELGNVDATEYLYFGSHWLNVMSSLGDRIKSITTLLSNALVESEMVSRNCHSRCKEQGIAYYRFNPKLEQVISAGETDITILTNMIMAARSLTVTSCQFQKLPFRFMAISDCNNKMTAALRRNVLQVPRKRKSVQT